MPDRADTSRSGGGIENSGGYLHAFVKKVLRLLLIVELIGGLAVGRRQHKSISRFHDCSTKHPLRCRVSRVLIRLGHRLLLGCLVARRVGIFGASIGRHAKHKVVVSATTGNSMNHANCVFFMADPSGRDLFCSAKDASALPTVATGSKLLICHPV